MMGEGGRGRQSVRRFKHLRRNNNQVKKYKPKCCNYPKFHDQTSECYRNSKLGVLENDLKKFTSTSIPTENHRKLQG